MRPRYKDAPRDASTALGMTKGENMKFKEISEMSTDELLTKKRDLRQESLHLRLQQQSGQLEQPSRLKLLRRDVARVETALARRQAEPKKK